MKKIYLSLKHAGCVFVFFITIMLIMIFVCCPPSYASEDTGETYAVGFKQGERTIIFSECDATDDYVFFAYDEGNLVDAYDYAGNFQFTLFFEDYIKGGIEIGSYDNQLYVCTKKNTVFVFDGPVLIQEMAYSTVIDLGLSSVWFPDDHNVQVGRNNVYRVSGDGQKTALGKTPQVIAENLPLILISAEATRVINIVGAIATVLLVVVIWVIAIIRIMKTIKAKPYRLG